MDDSELERLSNESEDVGGRCRYYDNCPDYQPGVMCNTHIHITCENFKLQYDADKFLKNYRNNEGDYRQDGD